MNILSLDIGKESETNENTLLLYIDNIEFRRIILDNSSAAVFYDLEKSTEGTGDYLLFTCTCGVADCGGWNKVQVLHRDKIVTWTFAYNNKQHVFSFNMDDYVGEIYKMKKRIEQERLILSPEFVTDPE